MDKIMKRVEIVQNEVVKLQTQFRGLTNRSSNAEINILYEDVVRNKEKLESLYESFYEKKDASTDPGFQQTFDTISNAIQALQIEVGELKRKREEATANRRKSTPFKLEKIKLPPFNGNFTDWQNFQDLFKSAVETNQHLTESEKMVYLKSSVIGEAASIVSSFSTASTSFADAWDLVKARYSNLREIIFAHLRKFDDMKPVQESSSGLRKLADSINELVRSLEALKVPVSYWDLILIYLALRKLDAESKKEWILTLGVDLPKLKEFVAFIEKRATALADSNVAKSKSSGKSSNEKSSSSHHVSASKTTGGKLSCVKCFECHYLHQCKPFSSLQPPERWKIVSENNLCYNCLFKGHSSASCRISSHCKKCGMKHHTLIRREKVNVHNDNSSVSSKPVVMSSQNSSSDTATSSSSHQVSSNHSESPNHHHQSQIVLFETGIGLAINSSGQRQQCRIFFDPGSESHFITENCVNRLGLHRQKTCVQVGGIGGAEGGTANGMVSLTVHSKYSDSFVAFNALVMKKITKHMPRIECQSAFTHLRGLQLADPSFHSPGPIDILIGAPLTGKIKLPGFIVGPTGLPDAQNTIFGWVLSGQAPCSTSSSSSMCVQTFHSECSIHEPCLDSSLKRFWELEEPDSNSSSCNEDDQAEQHFQSSFTRNEEGRYAVRLPFISHFHGLGESRSKAVQRLLSIERSLLKNPDMKSSYHDQFDELITNGLVEEVSAEEINSSNSYYMPHHVVSKLESSSTKYRIVFDASCKSSSGQSLNDVLFTGPKIQTDIAPILIKFRTHVIAMSADIVKFYNQFIVQKPDVDFQRLVFRSSPNEIIKDYRMLRVCFGVTTAPFLAIRCLHQLAEDHKSSHPLMNSIIKNDFLVDNLLTGAATVEEAADIQNQLIEIMSHAKLKLKKWVSNKAEIVHSVPEEDRETILPCFISEDAAIKTIGLLWNPVSDSFSVKLHEPTIKPTGSKRQVLSSIARTFDPLGWLLPVTIRIKILLQLVWKEKLDWDSPLPSHLYSKWYKYCSQLSSLKIFNIPRCIRDLKNPNGIYIVNGFCDASNHAYAACVYLSSENSSILIAAKTKVTPVKGETIPRLELCGAVLLAKLVHSVVPHLNLNVSSVNCWTDSNIVLGWLNSSEKLPIFVNNRVRTIKGLIPNVIWQHVKGEENPADLSSRGMSVKSFLNSQVWLHGPSWLSSNVNVTFSSVGVASVSLSSSYFHDRVMHLIHSSSDFVKMKRFIAFWIRFVHNLNKNNAPINGQLSVAELKSSLHHLVRAVQREPFQDEINRLTNQQHIRNHLKSMSLFLDDDGILRVGGRLRRSFYVYDKKHPMLLPKNHHFTNVLIRFFHETYHHAGPQLLLALLREKFWIIRGPQMCSKVVRDCIVCLKSNPRPLNQIMGQLPAHRVMPSRPFTNVGVDYAGPFYLCVTPGRRPRIIKAYVCIFICLAVKAVHLEFSGDLSTPSYVAAFKRFISRRGLPVNVFCDGGKNFLGARNEVQEIQQFISSASHQQHLQKFFVEQEITYHFNPPYGPHHGGIYESAVKSMKHHLKRIVGDRHLSIEEFITLLCQVEAALNSRPITPLSSDSNDFSYLSPGHFLTGGPLLAEPQRDLSDIKVHHLTRWQLVQRMNQHFFRRWSSQYIQALQQKSKWFETQTNLGVGQLVLVQDPESDIGPQRWNLGRISAVFPGNEGLVRVSEVKVPVTKNGNTKVNTYRRPIVRISPLPIQQTL